MLLRNPEAVVTMEDLKKVPGIGDVLLRRLKEHFFIEPNKFRVPDAGCEFIMSDKDYTQEIAHGWNLYKLEGCQWGPIETQIASESNSTKLIGRMITHYNWLEAIGVDWNRFDENTLEWF